MAIFDFSQRAPTQQNQAPVAPPINQTPVGGSVQPRNVDPNTTPEAGVQNQIQQLIAALHDPNQRQKFAGQLAQQIGMPPQLPQVPPPSIPMPQGQMPMMPQPQMQMQMQSPMLPMQQQPQLPPMPSPTLPSRFRGF